MALLLWCFCPYVLGHGALITPDVPAATMGISACYLFWRWLNSPKTWETLLVGIVLGLAELTKFTLLIFYPLWILIWLFYKWPEHRLKDGRAWLRELGLLAGMYFVSLVVINLGYDWTFAKSG
jgi:4-amino-4-deoxy-L-arabinose transferase-like glycosyltransferase